MTFPSQFRDNADQSIGLLFIRTYHRWYAKIKDALKTIEITHPQFIVLASLGYLSQNNEEVTQVDIANNAKMDAMTTSQVLSRLERDGYLIRKVHSTDSRAKSLFLTEEGKKTVQKALPLIESVDEQFFAPLNDQKHPFMSMLRQLNI